jgi:hypothetical protein
LQPLAALGTAFEGRARHTGECGDGPAEVLVVVTAEIVHDVVQDSILGMSANVIFEKPAEDVTVVIVGATNVDFARGRI